MSVFDKRGKYERSVTNVASGQRNIDQLMFKKSTKVRKYHLFWTSFEKNFRVVTPFPMAHFQFPNERTAGHRTAEGQTEVEFVIVI